MLEEEVKTEDKSAMTSHHHTTTSKKSCPLSAFNASRSKLGKLPMLLKYVSKNMEQCDFVVQTEFDGDMCETQLDVLRVFDKLSRSERRDRFNTIALYLLMRYKVFTVEQRKRGENSAGITILVRDC